MEHHCSGQSDETDDIWSSQAIFEQNRDKIKLYINNITGAEFKTVTACNLPNITQT